MYDSKFPRLKMKKKIQETEFWDKIKIKKKVKTISVYIV